MSSKPENFFAVAMNDHASIYRKEVQLFEGSTEDLLLEVSLATPERPQFEHSDMKEQKVWSLNGKYITQRGARGSVASGPSLYSSVLRQSIAYHRLKNITASAGFTAPRLACPPHAHRPSCHALQREDRQRDGQSYLLYLQVAVEIEQERKEHPPHAVRFAPPLRRR